MLIYSIIIILLSVATNSIIKKAMDYSKISIITMLYLIYITYNNTDTIIKKLSLFNDLFVLTTYSQIFNFIIYIITLLILILTGFFPYENEINRPNSSINNNILYKKTIEIFKYLDIKEYSLIILFIIMGANLLIMSNDIISIFLCIELQSYSIYILCGLNRNSESSMNASIMYFLIGGLASSIILLGQSYIYINTGNTNMEGIKIITNILDTLFMYNELNTLYSYIQYSLVITAIGFLFKISSAPFHF